MKVPAIRSKIGSWTYYITTLTFEQISTHVEKIDDQLHKSKGLRDLIQRSITDNYIKIKEYIENQPEMFFNSVVLGVYDGMPKWIEVELSFGDEEYFNMGFLDFPEDQKIFPIDGQHRVEGIKAALLEKPELKENKIGAIFIGHSKDDAGMEKSRRLFTTLNRYAKPVTMDDIIALDEDDSVAIATRYLLENFNLFKGEKVTKSQNKAIPDKDKTSITSIITLYQCNKELLKLFRIKRKKDEPNSKRDKKSLTDYMRFRPDEEEIQLFENYLVKFWTIFQEEIEIVQEYLQASEEEQPARNFRRKADGGYLLFRPVGLLPFVQALIEVKKREDIGFRRIMRAYNLVDGLMSEIPWKNVLWNPSEKTMIMGNNVLVKLLLIYMYDPNLLTDKEYTRLAQKYSDSIGFEDEDLEDSLEDIPTLEE